MTKRRQALISALGSHVQGYQRSTDFLDDTVADHLDLNRTDLRCLDWLFDGPKAAGQLGEATGLSSAATTTLVDRLERKDLVRRFRDASDRRKVLVELTDRARDVTTRLYGPLVLEGATLLERYTDDEIAMLSEFFHMSSELTDRHRSRIERQPIDDR